MTVTQEDRERWDAQPTLRDQFAVAALMGLIIVRAAQGGKDSLVQLAYEYADAMLKAREVRPCN